MLFLDLLRILKKPKTSLETFSIPPRWCTKFWKQNRCTKHSSMSHSSQPSGWRRCAWLTHKFVGIWQGSSHSISLDLIDKSKVITIALQLDRGRIAIPVAPSFLLGQQNLLGDSGCLWLSSQTYFNMWHNIQPGVHCPINSLAVLTFTECANILT